MRRLLLTTIATISCLGCLSAALPASAQTEVLMTPEASKDDYLTTLRGLRRRPAGSASTSGSTGATTGVTVKGLAMPIYFPYDSAELTLDAKAQLDNLGAALASDEFRGARWSIEGHTDASGSAPYNQSLSERRAASVHRYLVQQYGIPVGQLKSVGKGEAELLDAANPRSGVNRRVRVTYIGE